MHCCRWGFPHPILRLRAVVRGGGNAHKSELADYADPCAKIRLDDRSSFTPFLLCVCRLGRPPWLDQRTGGLVQRRANIVSAGEPLADTKCAANQTGPPPLTAFLTFISRQRYILK